MFDRSEALQRDSYHNVAMNYGTLPRAPRRPPPAGSSLPMAREGPPVPARHWSHLEPSYATLTHPRRVAPQDRPADTHYRQPVQASRDPAPSPPSPQHHTLRSPHTQGPVQPLRLDVPPESDWRTANYQTGTLGTRNVQQQQQQPPFARVDSRVRLARSPSVASPLCVLCQRAPAEPMDAYCRSCGAHMARFRTTS